jgi:hypothetical protein
MSGALVVIRSAAAVVAGYLLFALTAVALFQATGQAPHARASPAFMLGTACYGMFFAAAGGWLAAYLSRARPLLQGLLLAALIGAGATVSLMYSGAAATWSQWQALLLMAPMAVAGAALRARQCRARR